MVGRPGGSRARWAVVALVALSAGCGRVAVATSTSVDLYDLYPDCEGELDRIGDGYCDDATNNNEECGFDGGDCCECDCVIPADASEDQLAYSCVQFSCDDTSSACYVVPAPTPTPVAASEDGDTVETAESAAMTATAAAVSTTAAALAVTLISGAVASGW
ncbi:unnamed protein product [Ectocarpus sp. 12 AP-2014]